MLKKLLVIISLLMSACGRADINVIVIDTGLDLSDIRFANVLCKKGHIDFTNTGIKDVSGHGTHVAGLIMQEAGQWGYCLTIYKYSNGGEANPLAAMYVASRENAKYVNFSSGGEEFNFAEYFLLLASNNTFVVAAGNKGLDLDIKGNVSFPSSYGMKNVIPVGNLNLDRTRNSSSNYGSVVKAWEIGTEVVSTLPNNTYGSMTGSSMSTARHTGRLIKHWIEH